ncbi:hypothetical protein C8K18_13126 [Paraburkholderia sp. GV068]|uniref:lysozyme inhibitor LprI family protein n=1 Tax=Paraburkholderia TaxID=1822464 RepID=UPI000D2FC8EC|nr:MULTISPECIES: lysozyme inhibitor LprI family protein [unclassified Paraburkholderia]PTQ91431.1 hypothetical protein C8K19_1303 [Paraburkholderia sp. GV072]PUA93649.1 hypothetical protein C8K18_13126 [Paraburkholderia sp. GV068]
MKKILLSLIASVSILSVATTLRAASFDCEKAHSSVERIICTDEVLNGLDFRLAVAYIKAMDRAADQDGLLHSQREWVRSRDGCNDAACLKKAYHDRLAALENVQPAGFVRFEDKDAGVAFDYLANRRVKKTCAANSHECEFSLVRRNMGSSDYIVPFALVTGTLEQVAGDGAGFEQDDDGKWVTSFGPGVPQEVQRFHGHGWKGMRATISCGVSDPETGFHAAGGNCFGAVMSNGKRAVVVDTEGLLGNDPATMRSVESFQFLR